MPYTNYNTESVRLVEDARLLHEFGWYEGESAQGYLYRDEEEQRKMIRDEVLCRMANKLLTRKEIDDGLARYGLL